MLSVVATPSRPEHLSRIACFVGVLFLTASGFIKLILGVGTVIGLLSKDEVGSLNPEIAMFHKVQKSRQKEVCYA